MIDPQQWTTVVLAALQKKFGRRLQYLGLQGSHRRGEATEASDIDLVVLMDALALADLDEYREIVRAMPEGHKACGFICEAGDLAHWPRHELFPFKMDTDDYYGKLDDFLPPLTQDDLRAAAKINVSALLHTLTHGFVYAAAETRPVILQGAYKSAFFAMQVVHSLASGVYCRSKKELLARLTGEEREIIVAGANFSAWAAAHSENHAFALLREWCRKVLVNA